MCQTWDCDKVKGIREESFASCPSLSLYSTPSSSLSISLLFHLFLVPPSWTDFWQDSPQGFTLSWIVYSMKVTAAVNSCHATTMDWIMWYHKRKLSIIGFLFSCSSSSEAKLLFSTNRYTNSGCSTVVGPVVLSRYRDDGNESMKSRILALAAPHYLQFNSYSIYSLNE